MSADRRKLSFREDWPAIPYATLILIGIALSAFDLVVLQGLRIQLHLVITGIALLVVGGSIKTISRITLKKAGFGLANSARLRVVEKQKIVTYGVYGWIRHPLYLGEMIRNVSFPVAAGSLYGLVLMLIGNALLLFRIQIEERMLVEEFGKEYEEYMRRTRKLIPYFY